MHWLKVFFIQAVNNPPALDKPEWLQYIIYIVPIFTFLAALANLLLANYVFRFARKKNDYDRNIKWFQELIFTPNKTAFFAYFENLHKIRDKIPPDVDPTNDERIAIMEFIKTERSVFLSSFVDLIKPVAPSVYSEILKSVDQLTDQLIKALDNDELRLSNHKTYTREVSNKINIHRTKIVAALFNYKG